MDDAGLFVRAASDLHHRILRGLEQWHGWVGDTPGFNDDLNAILHSIKAKTLFVASPRDQFVPKQDYETQVNAIPDARIVWIDSVAGHFICCNDDPNATRTIDAAISRFLDELSAKRRAAR